MKYLKTFSKFIVGLIAIPFIPLAVLFCIVGLIIEGIYVMGNDIAESAVKFIKSRKT